MQQKEELSVTNEAMQQAGSPVGIGQIIGKTFDEYTQNFSRYILYSFLISIPTIVTTIIAILGVGGDTASPPDDISPGFGVGILLGGAVFLILSVLLTIVVGNAMYFDALASFRKKALGTVKESLQFGWDNAARIFLVNIVVSVITIAGLILLIIPGIVFWLWYVFAATHSLDTGEGVNESLTASKKISKGNYWTIIGVTVVYTIGGFILGLLSVIPVFGDAINLLASILITPILLIGFSFMYLAFKGESV